MRHIHLDPLGGAAGDMFVAALLDAFPRHAPDAVRAAAALSGAACRLAAHDDGTLTGRRFLVDAPHGAGAHDHGPGRHSLHGGHDHAAHDHPAPHPAPHPAHDHALPRDAGGDHAPDAPGRCGTGRMFHVKHSSSDATSPDFLENTALFPENAAGPDPDRGSWRALRARIEAADLPAGVLGHALGIFGCLAGAEARVHGVSPDEVVFHEVGAADSVADILAAAWVIAAVGPAAWSVGTLPLGSGTVRTAHGPMPVPAPATALLLEGFAVRDDGVGGERVTPTGAAILRHLGCAGAGLPRTATLRGSGTGFGSRRLPGMSNCLRALVLDTAEPQEPEPPPSGHDTLKAGTPGLATPSLAAPSLAAPGAALPGAEGVAPGPASGSDFASGHRALAVISFEVDDQSGEELAAGLDRVREAEGVHDVVQIAAFGKKNRMATHVQVLVRPDRLEAAVEACFRETTTIGLRTHLVQGRALPRRFAEVMVDGHTVVVKLVERPGGVTAKTELDSARPVAGHAARTRLRREAERLADADGPLE
jgi:uncharacterized protein (DUF111 family)